MIIFLWILFSIFVGVWGSNKKIPLGGVGAFIVSLIFSPIVGAIAVALTKSSEFEILHSGKMKKCPKCAELVKKEALTCRYCSFEFGNEETQKSSSK